MFKKLRIKFIAITMVMVTIVMAFAFTVVCVVEYQRSSSVVQTALENAVQEAVISSDRVKERFAKGFSEGQADEDSLMSGDLKAQDAASSDALRGQGPQSGQHELSGDTNFPGPIIISDEDTKQVVPPSIGFRPGQQRASSSLVPLAVYKLDENGTLSIIPEITTASIDSDVLQEAADLAAQSQDGYGSFNNLGLHYYKQTGDDTSYLAFADTSYTDSWKSLALILAGSGIVTLALFFIVSLFYSRWALRPVKEAWDSQRQFVADASHDLKTPLTVILANTAILLKHPERSIASESQWIESTQTEAEQMQGLVNEMLELVQIEASQNRERESEPIDLSDLLDGETLLFDSVALERNCLFECSIEPGLSTVGDQKQIKKMFSTLIENAFKYVDENGRIDVSMAQEGKKAVIAIHNSGSTISEEDLPHIFDRFYRTDKARTSGAGGFGLGLSIAREIARQHNGDISCMSAETDGTTFTVTLPVSS